jgi:hypothetical protein
MLISVELKPFHQWPGLCTACKSEGYESFATFEQMERSGGLWVEIDTAKVSGCWVRDPFAKGLCWHTTRESVQRVMDAQGTFPGLTVTEEDAKQMVFCEHMIQPDSFFIGKVFAYLHRIGLLKQFPKNHPPAKPADPLVGKFFLSMSRCAGCGATRVDGRGEVVERIPGADAYLVHPFTLGPKLIRATNIQRIQGHEMACWNFYESIPLMLADQQELERVSHQHDQPVHVN